MSGKEKIAEVAAQCPNLKEVWKTLKEAGVVTIAYSTFCNVYRDVFLEGPATGKAPEIRATEASPERSAERQEQKPRKPLPEINKFTLPTGSDGVRDQW